MEGIIVIITSVREQAKNCKISEIKKYLQVETDFFLSRLYP